MQLITSSIAILALASTAVAGPAPKCLNRHEVPRILGRWNAVWESGGAQKAYKIVAPEGKVYYEDFGHTDPLTGPAEVAASWATEGATTNPITYSAQTTLQYWYNCDTISQRWSVQATYHGGDASATVPPGTQVTYKGIDVLTIDVPSKLVTYAVTSEDDLTLYRGLGYNTLPAV